MGSHVIDLLQYIIGTNEMNVETSKKESVVSDIDDIVDFVVAESMINFLS